MDISEFFEEKKYASIMFFISVNIIYICTYERMNGHWPRPVRLWSVLFRKQAVVNLSKCQLEQHSGNKTLSN